MKVHLNEEQFYRLLDEDGACDRVAAEHVEHCTQCREEMEGLRQSVTSFQKAAAGISNAYASARLLRFEPAARSAFLQPRLAWAGGLAAVLFIATGSVSLLHRASTPSPSSAPVALTTSQASIAASDDALLEGINQDLSTSVPPPLEPLDSFSVTEKNISSNVN